MIEDFLFNICEENAILPKSLLGTQFYSNFIVKVVQENYNHIIYFISCSIERDNYLNNYKFYLKYNKEKDYYILSDVNGNTVDVIYDNENDYSTIEQSIINNMLINLCGHIPKLYFGDILNKVYSKINKYLNNNLRKISILFRNKLLNLENCLNKLLTIEDIQKYDYYLFKEIQLKIINLFIKIDNKEFIVDNVAYKIEFLKFENVFLNSSTTNYSFKIAKTNLKINKIKYLY